MQHKNLDMIIANDVGNPSIGFNSDDNAVTLLSSEGSIAFPEMSKAVLARRLIAHIASVCIKKRVMHDIA